MTVRSRVLFGVPVFSGSYQKALSWLLDSKDTFRRVVTINPIILESARQDDKMLEWIKTADLVVPDGNGVCLAIKRFFKEDQAPITGVQLVHDILESGSYKVTFIGASAVSLNKAVEVVEARYPSCTVVGSHHGFFLDSELDQIVKVVVAADPDFIFVGMGYPKQEVVIQALSKILNQGVAIGVGGVIDVLSGEVAWAPKWIRNLRLEWLYRIIKEPKRVKHLPLMGRFLFRTFFGQNI